MIRQAAIQRIMVEVGTLSEELAQMCTLLSKTKKKQRRDKH